MSTLFETLNKFIELRFSGNTEVDTWLVHCEPSIVVELDRNEPYTDHPSEGLTELIGINNLIYESQRRMIWLSSIFRGRISQGWTWAKNLRIINTTSIGPATQRTFATIVFFAVSGISVNIQPRDDSCYLLRTATWSFDSEFSQNGRIRRVVEFEVSTLDNNFHILTYPSKADLLENIYIRPRIDANYSRVTESIEIDPPVGASSNTRRSRGFVEVLRDYKPFSGIPLEILLLSFLGRDFDWRDDVSNEDAVFHQFTRRKGGKESDILPNKVRKRPLAWLDADVDLEALSRKQSIKSSMNKLCPCLESEVFDGSLPIEDMASNQWRSSRGSTSEDKRDVRRSLNKMNARRSRSRKVVFDEFLTCAVEALENAISKAKAAQNDGHQRAAGDCSRIVSSPGPYSFPAPDVYSSMICWQDITLDVMRMVCSKHPRREPWNELCDSDLKLSFSCPTWKKDQGIPDISDINYYGKSICRGLEEISIEIERRNRFFDAIWGSADWTAYLKKERVSQTFTPSPTQKQSFTWHVCHSSLTTVDIELVCDMQSSVNTRGKVTEIAIDYDVQDFIHQMRAVAYRVYGIRPKRSVRKMFESSSVVSLVNERLQQAWKFLCIRRSHLFQVADLPSICSHNIVYRGPPPPYSKRVSGEDNNDNCVLYESLGIDSLMEDTSKCRQCTHEVSSTEYKIVNITVLNDTVVHNWSEDTMVFSYDVIFCDIRRHGPDLPSTSPQLVTVTNSCVVEFEEMTTSILRVHEIMHAKNTCNSLGYDPSMLALLQDRERPRIRDVSLSATRSGSHVDMRVLNLSVLKMKMFVNMRHSNELRDQHLGNICSPGMQLSICFDNRGDGRVAKHIGHYLFNGIQEIIRISTLRSEFFLSLIPNNLQSTYTWTMDVRFKLDNLHGANLVENELLVNFAYELTVYAIPTTGEDKSQWIRLMDSLSRITAIFDNKGMIRWCSEHIEVVESIESMNFQASNSDVNDHSDKKCTFCNADQHSVINSEMNAGNITDEQLQPI